MKIVVIDSKDQITAIDDVETLKPPGNFHYWYVRTKENLVMFLHQDEVRSLTIFDEKEDSNGKKEIIETTTKEEG